MNSIVFRNFWLRKTRNFVKFSIWLPYTLVSVSNNSRGKREARAEIALFNGEKNKRPQILSMFIEWIGKSIKKEYYKRIRNKRARFQDSREVFWQNIREYRKFNKESIKIDQL